MKKTKKLKNLIITESSIQIIWQRRMEEFERSKWLQAASSSNYAAKAFFNWNERTRVRMRDGHLDSFQVNLPENRRQGNFLVKPSQWKGLFASVAS